MNSRILLIVVAVFLTGLLAYKELSPPSEEMTIGILQTASHPALDQAREGFISEMTAMNSTKIDFVIQNAEGSLSQAQRIAENFAVRKKIKAVFAIGTPAVQAIAKVEKKKPIFLSAVSDPDSLGILNGAINICGTSDRINTDKQVKLICDVIPSVQTVAILYNPGEHNSQLMTQKMQESLKKQEIQSITLGVHSTEEITHAVTSAARKAEAIFIPNDNLLASAIPLVSKEALKHHCPLFISDTALLQKGGVIAQGNQYFELGSSTAKLACRVLFSEEKPVDVGIRHPESTQTFVNKYLLEKLNIALSEALLSSVTLETIHE